MDELSLFTPFQQLYEYCVTPPVTPQYVVTVKCPSCQRHWSMLCGLPVSRKTIAAIPSRGRWCDACLQAEVPESKLLGPTQCGCTSCSAEWEEHHAPDERDQRKEPFTPTALRFNNRRAGLGDIQYHGNGTDDV